MDVPLKLLVNDIDMVYYPFNITKCTTHVFRRIILSGKYFINVPENEIDQIHFKQDIINSTSFLG